MMLFSLKNRRAAVLALCLPVLTLGGCGSSLPEPITTPTVVEAEGGGKAAPVKKVVPGPAQAAPPFKRAR